MFSFSALPSLDLQLSVEKGALADGAGISVTKGYSFSEGTEAVVALAAVFGLAFAFISIVDVGALFQGAAAKAGFVQER